jgi:hypothetical protein
MFGNTVGDHQAPPFQSTSVACCMVRTYAIGQADSRPEIQVNNLMMVTHPEWGPLTCHDACRQQSM